MEIPGARENLTGASSTVGKLIQATGRATIQGAIQEIVGGKFKDGFINSMLANAAQEVGDLINAEIGKIPNLTPGGHPNSPTDGHLKLPHLS